MKRIVTVIVLCLSFVADAQEVQTKIDEQVTRLLADSQMTHAIFGFYVADARTGEMIYSHNGKAGLAPASTQKIVTSVAAFDLLGKDYRYRTELRHNGILLKGTLNGDLVIRGYGDPTFGSARYASTQPGTITAKFLERVKSSGIKHITGSMQIDVSHFSFQPLPGGWVWDDIGNYYGAGTWAVNWRENQYDLLLKPGTKEGDPVIYNGTIPGLPDFYPLVNLRTGRKGSGDNAYIYYPPYGKTVYVEGTFEGGSKISGSLPDAPKQLGFEMVQLLETSGIALKENFAVQYGSQWNDTTESGLNILYTHYSPAMDSIVYWFMRKSINLYGEALVKTIGMEISGVASTDSGVAVLRRYFKEKGIAVPAELKIIDGSGLSPSNRLSAESLVKILVYARNQSWFPAFQESFPEFNQMKLKSGTIRGAKSFAGYHTSKNGREYAVAIIVNNYDGSASSVVSKMYKVLDELK